MNEQTLALYARFFAPSAEWRGKPFWSWNGELEEKELCRQVEVLKEMGFGVKKDGCYARLTSLPQRLRFGSAAEQGLPFYGGNITYVIPASVFKRARESAEKDGARIFLCPDGVQGSLVHFDSDAQSGKAFFRPYRCDITPSVKAGCDVRLTLVGNRRCTFGPMHRLPAEHKGSSPGHFVSSGNEWSDEFAVPFTGIKKVTVETVK